MSKIPEGINTADQMEMLLLEAKAQMQQNPTPENIQYYKELLESWRRQDWAIKAILTKLGELKDSMGVLFSSPEMLASTMFGHAGATTQTDEGTENQSAEYQLTPSTISFLDEAVVIETGTYSLSIGHAGMTKGWMSAQRYIDTPFTWNQFIKMSFSLRRPAATTETYGVRVGLKTAEGFRAYKEFELLTNCPIADTWYNFTITKTDFTLIDSALTASKDMILQTIEFNDFSAGAGSIWFLDSWIFTSLGVITPLLVDSTGKLLVVA